MNSFDVIVYILSAFLAVFLVLAIYATVMLLKTIKKINAATDTAKAAMQNVQAFTSSIKGAADGTLASMLASKLWNQFKKSRNKKGN